VFRLLLFLTIMGIPAFGMAQEPQEIAKKILPPLLDPAKVATLKGDRPANARLYKVLGWLEMARQGGGDASKVIDQAQAVAGYQGSKAGIADKAAILWNFGNLQKWGCFTSEGLKGLRKGESPEITLGAERGQKLALDHVLPRAVVPELAARFYNLEAISEKQNLTKGAKISKRELDLAKRWRVEGLLSAEGLRAVEAAMK
jgi:hypothetical protein